nr:hypothetical protein [Tanacetum cinerariifolium]
SGEQRRRPGFQLRGASAWDVLVLGPDHRAGASPAQRVRDLRAGHWPYLCGGVEHAQHRGRDPGDSGGDLRQQRQAS